MYVKNLTIISRRIKRAIIRIWVILFFSFLSFFQALGDNLRKAKAMNLEISSKLLSLNRVISQEK